jgi:hypothetical protein
MGRSLGDFTGWGDLHIEILTKKYKLFRIPALPNRIFWGETSGNESRLGSGTTLTIPSRDVGVVHSA